MDGTKPVVMTGAVSYKIGKRLQYNLTESASKTDSIISLVTDPDI